MQTITDSTDQEEPNRGLKTRFLTAGQCSSPLSLTHLRDGATSSGVNSVAALSVGNFGYHELPKDHLLNLSILKLDGSLFEVHLSRKSTVGDLKQTVEEIFISSPKEGQGQISWSHVWGHFCLSYEGQKLLNDKAHIQNIGIKDGDQLQFVRHLSICNSPLRKLTKNEGGVTCKKSWRLQLGSNACQDKEQGNSTDDFFEDDEEANKPEFKLAHFLKGWLSYPRLRGLSRNREHCPRASRFSLQCLGGRPRIYSCRGN